MNIICFFFCFFDQITKKPIRSVAQFYFNMINETTSEKCRSDLQDHLCYPTFYQYIGSRDITKSILARLIILSMCSGKDHSNSVVYYVLPQSFGAASWQVPDSENKKGQKKYCVTAHKQK